MGTMAKDSPLEAPWKLKKILKGHAGVHANRTSMYGLINDTNAFYSAWLIQSVRLGKAVETIDNGSLSQDL